MMEAVVPHFLAAKCSGQEAIKSSVQTSTQQFDPGVLPTVLRLVHVYVCVQLTVMCSAYSILIRCLTLHLKMKYNSWRLMGEHASYLKVCFLGTLISLLCFCLQSIEYLVRARRFAFTSIELVPLGLLLAEAIRCWYAQVLLAMRAFMFVEQFAC